MVFPTDNIGESLDRISRKFHKIIPDLENAVHSKFASEPSDPRVQLLNEALHISDEADKTLSWINQKLTGILQDWQSQSDRLSVSDSDERTKLAKSISSLKRERDELETLSEIARALNSTLEFDAVLELVMDRVIRFVNAERGFLVLVNPKTGELEVTIARDKDSQPIARSKFAISQQTVKRVIDTRVSVLEDDALADDPTKSMLAYNIRSIMCAPLTVREHCIGAVYVDSQLTTAGFGPRHHELLQAFCNQAAIAIENARLFKQINEDKQYMDNIFGSIVNGVVTTDSAGIITKFNAGAGMILALPPEQVMGQHYTEAFKSLPQVGLVPLLTQAHKEHEHGTLVNETIECTIPGRRGTVSLDCYVSALRDTQGAHIGMALVIDDQTPMKEAKAVRRMFEQYVHPNVVRRLMEDPQALKLGGETKVISVIFADIRGYTHLSEGKQPHEVMNLINGYLDRMCAAIWQEEGTLTAFQGDALMAIFNAPLPQDDHALRAVRASWYMREAILAYQRELPEHLRVSFGIGVNTGWATVGNVGSSGRLQNYTAIGDAINVAARLQSNATDNEIYLNGSTCKQVYQRVMISSPISLKVKGKTGPLTVGRLLGLS